MSKLSVLAVLSIALLALGLFASGSVRAAGGAGPEPETTPGDAEGTPAEKTEQATSVVDPGRYFIFLGRTFGTALVIIGAAYGISKIGSAAVENMARQPEVAGNVQTAMIIAAALIEGITFFALIVCLLELRS